MAFKFTHWIALTLLPKISVPFLCGSFSRLSVLFHCSICLSLYQYHAVLCCSLRVEKGLLNFLLLLWNCLYFPLIQVFWDFFLIRHVNIYSCYILLWILINRNISLSSKTIFFGALLTCQIQEDRFYFLGIRMKHNLSLIYLSVSI